MSFMYVCIPYDFSEEEKVFHDDCVIKTSKFEFLSPSNNHRGGVALDTLQQIESHLIMSHYDGFMKSGRIQGRSRRRY